MKNERDVINKIIDNAAECTFGRTRTESHAKQICVACGAPATEFRDTLSKKEYNLSGFCQQCQDETFGG